ncbi:MAG: 6-carboxytetrahydropterin synthase QueD [Syntrophobacteraceae bacterium]|nr:6-carboxytetrahydropterin synthase QueD [Syntrophobacteraceae bacterium]
MPGVFEVYIKGHFSAAHQLRGYSGDCARLHGHNWAVEVHVRCGALDELGIGIDFRDIKAAVTEVLAEVDHCNLNETRAFTLENPTSENIARFLYRELGKVLNRNGVRVSRVKVSETPGAGALYWEE